MRLDLNKTVSVCSHRFPEPNNNICGHEHENMDGDITNHLISPKWSHMVSTLGMI